jgi:Sec-independent protein translocase protein TatA
MIVPLASLGNLFSGDMIIVAAVALMLFGKELPAVAKKVGRVMAEIKRAANDATSELHREINNVAQSAETPPSTPAIPPARQAPLPSIKPAPDTFTNAKPPAPAAVNAPPAISAAAALDSIRIEVKPPSKIPPPV